MPRLRMPLCLSHSCEHPCAYACVVMCAPTLMPCIMKTTEVKMHVAGFSLSIELRFAFHLTYLVLFLFSLLSFFNTKIPESENVTRWKRFAVTVRLVVRNRR